MHGRFTCVCFLFLATLAGAPALGQTWTRITEGPMVTDGGASRSVNWVDVDGNGTLDLFVTNGPSQGQNNCLYLNTGAPSFQFIKVVGDPAVSDSAKSDGATFGDLDNDGDPDLAVANWYGDDELLYLNNGDGSFTQVLGSPPAGDGGHSEACVFGDYDQDGHLDLFVPNSGNAFAEANFMYHNNGDGSLTRVYVGGATSDSLYSRGSTFVDYDADGDPDLFVTHENGQSEKLYKNLLVENGTATFTSVAAPPLTTSGATSFSGAWADYDNDRDPDVLVVNSSNQNEQLYNNQGGGVFTAVSGDPIVTSFGWSVTADWGDTDNDGDLDCFVSNAYGGTAKRNFFFRNQLIETGTASFVKETAGPLVNDLGFTFGAAFGDYDEDGDLDIFQARTWTENENNALYRNDLAPGRHWLELDLEGTASNRSGIGARVEVRAPVAGSPIWMTRTLQGENAYCGQNLRLHFGLGNATSAESLIVRWPSGAVDRWAALPVDTRHRIVEGAGVAASVPATGRAFLRAIATPNPFSDGTTIRYLLDAPGEVILELYDVAGRLRSTRNEGFLPAGAHRADLRLENGAAAIYYRLRAGGREATGRLVRLR